MTLHEYIAGIEKVSGQPVGPEGSPHWLRLAERYAETLKAIQERTPALMEQGIQFPENRVSRALFTAETGIAMPKTQRESLAVLVAYVGAEKVAEADRAKADAERLDAERKERDRIDRLTREFRGGLKVCGADLLVIARSMGVAVHPRTAGVLKKLATVNKDGIYSVYGRYAGTKPNGNTFWPLIEAVVGVADVTDDRHADAATQAAAESLFQPGGTLFASAV